ncbi:uncharacterized protein [Temnothorax longispinosus]|uniref:uncharacterized protein isoform X1 n=1 Tax=Temnothorax longispinosus TaxID=300112 RepID=UPI003A99D6FE
MSTRHSKARLVRIFHKQDSGHIDMKRTYSKRHIRRLVHNERLSLERGIHIVLPQQLNNSNNSDNYDQHNIEIYDRLRNSQPIHEVESTEYTDIDTANVNDVDNTSTSNEQSVLSLQSFNYIEDINDMSFVDENESTTSDGGNSENDDFNNFYEDQRQHEFVSEIAMWAVEFVSTIPLAAITTLLKILRKYTEAPFPKDARTLLKTPRTTNISRMESGQYCHLGLKNAIIKIIENYLQLGFETRIVNLMFNIDGVPLGKSSEKSLWPILCSDFLTKQVFLIGIYCGEAKPKDSNNLLEQTVNEAIYFINNGIAVNNTLFNIRVSGIICDAPAKAYILKVKSHNGYYSCTKCIIKGEYIDDTNCFPYDRNEVLRTDENFRNFAYNNNYQIGQTILCNIPYLGLVTNVLLDHMHLVCLGIVRKLLLLWITKPFYFKLSIAKKKQISTALINFRKYVPVEFSRKPRDLNYIKLWKATELRQFLLYTGPIALKGILDESVYSNFLTLHAAITILVSPHLSAKIENIQYARELLQHFVKCFQIIYGKKYVSHNVHNLLHLADDAEKFGPLDNFSAFRFENYLSTIKKLIRKGDKPLQQIARRLTEIDTNSCNGNEVLENIDNIELKKRHRNGPLLNGISHKNCRQFSILKTKHYFLDINNTRNDCVLLDNGIGVQIHNFIQYENESYLIGKEIMHNSSDLYTEPCHSRNFNIHVVTNNECEEMSNLKIWPCRLIKAKLCKLPYKRSFVLIPIIHTFQ